MPDSTVYFFLSPEHKFSRSETKMKPLGKLRYKPQVSEVFCCSSIGIDAQFIEPDERVAKSTSWRILGAPFLDSP